MPKKKKVVEEVVEEKVVKSASQIIKETVLKAVEAYKKAKAK